MYAYSLQDLRVGFSSFVSEQQLDPIGARSRFFLECGRYYDANSSMKSYLDDDVFFQKAEKLDTFFKQNSGSMERLQPLKEKYIRCWGDLCNTLEDQNSSDTELGEKVRRLVIVNKHFVRGFIEEMREVIEEIKMAKNSVPER